MQGQLSALQFEAEFLKLFEYDNTDFTEEEYKILNALFWAVEDFCAEPKLREEGDLDENQLLEAAQVASQALNRLNVRFIYSTTGIFKIHDVNLQTGKIYARMVE